MMKPIEYIFSTNIEVRDYECDIQGIVNNANYLHYAEHTRHCFLHHVGWSFAKMHADGEDPVVARMTLQYKAPLHPDDVAVSRMAIRKEGVKYIFIHDIYRQADDRLCFHAEVTLVCLIHGRMGESPALDAILKRYIKG